MVTCLEAAEKAGKGPVHNSRADTVRRWATEGARAFAGVQGEPLHLSPRPGSVLYRRCWFGSNGKCTGYTSEGVKKLLAEGPYTLLRHARFVGYALQHYSERFKYISTRRACEVLKDLGCGGDAFYWNSSSGRVKWTANDMLARRAVTTDATEPCNWVARAITPIDYMGGPPNKWGIYHGSLRSLMLDRLAAAILLGGIKGIDGIFKSTERYSGLA